MLGKVEQSKEGLKDLCINHVGCFQHTLLPRRETIEETLSLFKLEDVFDTNEDILDKTSHLYRTSIESLEPLREHMVRDTDLTYVEIVHKSSLLGLPYQIYAKHKSGYDLYFDGLSYLTYRKIRLGEFWLTEIADLAGHPQRSDMVIFSLEKALADLLPKMRHHSYSMYTFYTADIADWSQLGVQATGQPQLRIEVIDEDVVAVIGGHYAEHGKSYPLYIGDTKRSGKWSVMSCSFRLNTLDFPYM